MPVTLKDSDREIFAQELDSFVPDRVYDAHAHIYSTDCWKSPQPHNGCVIREQVTLEVYREEMETLLPGREVHGMHFPFPVAFRDDTGFAHENEWVSREIAKDPKARGQFLVRPTDDPEWVRQEVKRLGMRGLKPFSLYSSVEKWQEAEIPDYLPEPLAAVADEEGWSITLHMVRYHGSADPSNQHWIRYYCETYPNVQLILDHCARGFNPYQAMKGLSGLTGLDNLWVDTSVVCSPFSVEAVLRIIGPERTLYGSDYYVSHLRGTNFGVADTFQWLYEDAPVWEGNPWALDMSPTLIGLENLRAIRAACWSVGLSDRQVESIFWGNAAQLLSVT